MPKAQLSLKSTVTRKPAPVDADERAVQAARHQTAQILETAAPEPEPAMESEPETEKSGKQLKREAHALQSGFLSACLNKPALVYLINGIKLVGKVRQHDQYCLLLEGSDGVNSLIFKHSVSTIQVPRN